MINHHQYSAYPPAYHSGWYAGTSPCEGGDAWRQEGPPQPGFMDNWLDFKNTGYLRGFAVGAGLVLLLTNPTLQKALVSGVVKVWSAVQGGVEEVKEQIQDIKAEMSQKE